MLQDPSSHSTAPVSIVSVVESASSSVASLLPRSNLSTLNELQAPPRHEHVTRPDLFTKFSGEKHHHGDGNFGILCVSGFGASSYSMQELGKLLNIQCDAPTIVSPLACHETFERFKQTHFNDWVKQIIEQAERLPDPIGIFFSASSLAAIEAERQKPGLFKQLVFIGTPLKLNDTWTRIKISTVDMFNQALSMVSPALVERIKQLEVPTNVNYDDGLKQSRRCSVYTHSSVSSVLELYHGALRAYQGLRSINVPLLYLQGGKDPLISKDVPSIFSANWNPELLTVKIYPGDGHGPQYGTHKGAVFADIYNWIENQAAQRKINLTQVEM